MNDIKVRLHRVYTNQELDPGQEVSIRDRQAHYLARVLRVMPGQAICLFNGDGHDYAAEIIRPGKGEVLLAVNSRLPAVRESGLAITVVQAISRGERMDQTLQKCTELGVQNFQPLFSERVEVRLKAEKLAKRMAHWQAVVISACEQCGRAVIPGIRQPLGLDDWLNKGGAMRRLVLAPGSDRSLVRTDIPGQVEIAVGPEGGFSKDELRRMLAHSVLPVSLGPRVLRTETAAPAAAAILQALGGDLS